MEQSYAAAFSILLCEPSARRLVIGEGSISFPSGEILSAVHLNVEQYLRTERLLISYVSLSFNPNVALMVESWLPISLQLPLPSLLE